MFSFFKKIEPSLITDTDEIYGSRRAADDALVNTALMCEYPTIVSSFFPASLARIKDILDRSGMNGRTLNLAEQSRPTKTDDGPWLFNANMISTSRAFDSWLLRSGAEVQFLFVEHYPLLRIERSLLDLLESVSKTHPQRVRFFAGLDDPLFDIFGADSLRRVMKTLGMNEDEKISHPMINKSIRTAMTKIDGKVQSPLPADSYAEWFERNFTRSL
jgi:hypothetical protein